MIARRDIHPGAVFSGLLGAAALVVFALSVGVGSGDAYAGTAPRKTEHAWVTTATTIENAAHATPPNLDDPTIRARFVCSFAPGSFGISPELPYDLEGGIDCSGSDAAGSYENIPPFGLLSSGLEARRVG
jgi:hypothetical protein